VDYLQAMAALVRRKRAVTAESACCMDDNASRWHRHGRMLGRLGGSRKRRSRFGCGQAPAVRRPRSAPRVARVPLVGLLRHKQTRDERLLSLLFSAPHGNLTTFRS
jgi:hypothetical protein